MLMLMLNVGKLHRRSAPACFLNVGPEVQPACVAHERAVLRSSVASLILSCCLSSVGRHKRLVCSTVVHTVLYIPTVVVVAVSIYV